MRSAVDDYASKLIYDSTAVKLSVQDAMLERSRAEKRKAAAEKRMDAMRGIGESQWEARHAKH